MSWEVLLIEFFEPRDILLFFSQNSPYHSRPNSDTTFLHESVPNSSSALTKHSSLLPRHCNFFHWAFITITLLYMLQLLACVCLPELKCLRWNRQDLTHFANQGTDQIRGISKHPTELSYMKLYRFDLIDIAFQLVLLVCLQWFAHFNNYETQTSIS